MAAVLPEDLRDQRIISTRLSAELMGISIDTLTRIKNEKENGFPKPIKVGVRRYGFRLCDLQAWMAGRTETAALRVDAGRR